ncbi:YhcH/YjgK/YiaL family protein [Zhouia amylolytica]|uniref:YhcH/YjgK/YiaL family protein n=1 Tax=Zhouia amylolytica TaxID=376730 RepID=UPI0020CD2F2C|nr:YhcH/YjgK/YiaL family protein [Zhouia amylolytica]MCQ0113115.1 YhcH/YjgK/YiaL family protein [Zhouia amylolytica]
MIYDLIENRSRYLSHPVFDEIFEKLLEININTENGIHFKTNDYYFKVMSYQTKTSPEILEDHQKEVDIQILISGEEGIRIYNEENVEVVREYKEVDDCQFYRPIGGCDLKIELRPGFMAIFFENDIHQPQFAVNHQEKKIKKIVIKVNEKFFS